MKNTKLSLFCSVLTMLVVMILLSCTGSKTVKLKVSETNNFPVMELNNPYGTDIIIQPVSSDKGSIGFKLNGEIFWLSGEPSKKVTDKDLTKFTWEINGKYNAELEIIGNKDELNFQMKLISDENDAKAEEWLFNIKALEDEYFTGALERVVDGFQGKSWSEDIKTAMNLRNEIVEIKVKSTVAAYAPFFLSSNNYGLYVHGTWPGIFDFCKSDSNTVQVSFEGSELSFKFYLSSSPKEIVKKHALETGPSYLAPKWAFGPWRWRDEHSNNKVYFDGSRVKSPYNSDITEDILMMQAYDIPCTAYWIDRPWGPGTFGYDDFEIDYKRLPEFEEMISWLNSKNIELMLWICPWAYGKMADTAGEKGYGLIGKNMMRPVGGFPGGPGGPNRPVAGMPDTQGRPGIFGFTERGNRFDNMPVRQENMTVMDFTNPEAVKWWGESGPAKLAKMGVKGFKLDRGDGERLCDSLHLKTFSGISYRENYNDYCRQFVKTTYDAVKSVLGDDFILFPRAQYTGSARYGAMWAGDTYSSDKGLRSVVIALQRCAVMGYPLWTSDACGYSGPVDREVSMRWIGFSCFSPVMEIGPTNNKGFWDLNSDPTYDNELIAVWRFYSNLRMSLIDYVYGVAKNASETGMPVARPLFLEYPEQEECWNNWETYKFGDDLLVSVIWEKGVTKQQVYLPSGETWIDLWNNKEYEGGQYIEVDALLYQTPVFLRKGSTLVLPDFNKLYEESVKVASVKYKMTDLEAKEGWR
jgi:alpha-D-xyloside xylohydrolase